MSFHKFRPALGVAMLSALSLVTHAAAPDTPRRPNILLVVADDLGYSDIGAFGGEIKTPTLDGLAKSGVRLSGFYASPFCSPTRAMLLSGMDNHLAGMGTMGELINSFQKGKPGYEGYLNNRVAPFPEVLRQSGYHTYMVGKWHVGLSEEVSPAKRGFEQSYALVQGGAAHWDQTGIITFDANKAPVALYRENGKQVNLPEKFYSSEFYADRMIQYIDSNKGDGKPFLAYVAFTAPHWPLQAPESFIKKYEDTYKVGYEVIRKQRIAKMKEMGIIPKDTQADQGNPVWPKWSQLSAEQKKQEAKRMAVYAAMVDAMDYHLGRIIDHLKKTGEYDNTFIFFMSDNGAEGNTILDEGQDRSWSRMHRDNSVENIGKATSFAEYGPNWAQVGAAPFRMYKAFQYEGGISSPAIAVYPKLQGKGTIKPQFSHVTDVAPTLLELAGLEPVGRTYEGREVIPMQGKSMLSFLTGQAPAVHGKDHVTGWELGGRKAIRKGDWKLVYANWPWGAGRWELFDLAKDRTEQHNLADKYPKKVEELLAAYQDYMKTNGVVDAPGIADRPGYSNSVSYYDDVANEAAPQRTNFYDPVNAEAEK
ncbi:MAG: arylsulfatase [Rhodocyclaceae bacterium]|nr:MAG: arylsulfatase [Rhodocyclaceae bacterium]